MVGRRKKQREKSSGPKGAPEWVVTFTDMISLLVTFFVLLMTFSSLESFDALQVDSFLNSTAGVHRNPPQESVAELGDEDLVEGASLEAGSPTPHSRPPDELPDDIQEMGQRRTEEHQELDLTKVADGIVLEFGEAECFDPGSARVNEALRSTLEEAGEVLQHYPHLIVVEGFTDGAFQPDARYDSAEALSLARARNAARVLLETSDMHRDLIQLAGHGANGARADNESPGGRRLNRRVQVRIMALSQIRANHFAAHRNESLKDSGEGD